MKKEFLRITFDGMTDQGFKATVYEGDNRFLFIAYGSSITNALMEVARLYSDRERMNELSDNLERRAD